MAARAIWKGSLKLGSTKVPIKLYSAVEDQGIHFHILDSKTRTRVKQHVVNPETDEEVPREDVRKGFEIERGTFVLLEESELEKLEPQGSRDIEVLQFVAPEEINHQWYERPYYAGPDGDADAYFALAEALRNREKEGVVRWVMRGKQYFGALRAEGDYIVIVTLRNSEEVLSASELPSMRGRPVDAKELRMAEQLVGMLEGDFNPADFADEYRDRVMQLIKAKAKGRKPKLKVVRNKTAATSLSSQLAASLKSAKREEKKVA
jgi:DNA end-binding protein Ku